MSSQPHWVYWDLTPIVWGGKMCKSQNLSLFLFFFRAGFQSPTRTLGTLYFRGEGLLKACLHLCGVACALAYPPPKEWGSLRHFCGTQVSKGHMPGLRLAYLDVRIAAFSDLQVIVNNPSLTHCFISWEWERLCYCDFLPFCGGF